MLWTTAIVFVLVIAFVIAGIVRDGVATRSRGVQRPQVVAVSVAVAATTLILIGLLAASIWTGRTLEAFQAPSAITVNVVGHQWWWEFEYEEGVPAQRVQTANEFHIPVGRPIVLKVTSRDVIHSLWLPNLQGKRDLIPGYTTAIWLQADHPGIYRGQCAEFCGMQHAHMAFDVVAESPEQFSRWLARQLAPATPPAGERAVAGTRAFEYRCGACHTVRGTLAGGTAAPDLTHLMTRASIGANTLPTNAGTLSAWIVNPQSPKPGNHMPVLQLTPDEVASLDAFLVTLN